jgi:antitoxin component YwqK of YwqJK toxin-antitoxin module
MNKVNEVKEVISLSSDIYYIIGLHIDNARTFFNFVCVIKDIQCKDILIKLKKEEYKKEFIQYDNPFPVAKKTYFILPNGAINGDYIERHYNNSIKIKCHYVNGKKEGLYIERSCSSMNTLILKCNYKDDLLDGDYEMWHDDSSNKLKTFYINGVKSRDEICWIVNGDIIRCRGEKYNEYKNKKNGEKTNNASNPDFIFRCKNNESEKVEDYLEQGEIGDIIINDR